MSKKQTNKSNGIIILYLLIIGLPLYLIKITIGFENLIIIAPIILILLFIIRTNRFKGFYGELKTKLIIKNTLKENYELINNLTFYNNNCKSVQIDHILIIGNNILCIETKNIKGKITGKYNDLEWKINYQEDTTMYNPIKQNENHIKYLKEKFPELEIINIVLFINKNEKLPQFDEIYSKEKFKKYIKQLKNENQLVNYDIHNQIKAIDENIKLKEHLNNLKNN